MQVDEKERNTETVENEECKREKEKEEGQSGLLCVWVKDEEGMK